MINITIKKHNIGISPITGTVYYGTVNKKGDC